MSGRRAPVCHWNQIRRIRDRCTFGRRRPARCGAADHSVDRGAVGDRYIARRADRDVLAGAPSEPTHQQGADVGCHLRQQFSQRVLGWVDGSNVGVEMTYRRRGHASQQRQLRVRGRLAVPFVWLAHVATIQRVSVVSRCRCQRGRWDRDNPFSSSTVSDPGSAVVRGGVRSWWTGSGRPLLLMMAAWTVGRRTDRRSPAPRVRRSRSSAHRSSGGKCRDSGPGSDESRWDGRRGPPASERPRHRDTWALDVVGAFDPYGTMVAPVRSAMRATPGDHVQVAVPGASAFGEDPSNPPLSSTPAAVSSADVAAGPPERSMGIPPRALNACFGSSRFRGYSALPR